MAEQLLQRAFLDLDISPLIKTYACQSRELAEKTVFTQYLSKRTSQRSRKTIRVLPRGRRNSARPEPLYTKQDRKTQKCIAESKTRETQQFVNQLTKNQLEREKRKHTRTLELLREQEDDTQRGKHNKQEQKQRLIAQHRTHEEQKLLESQKLRAASSFTKQVHRKIPLYISLQNDYESETLLHELERRKTELAKRRLLAQPIPLEQLREHARQHDEYFRKKSTSKHERDLGSLLYLRSIPKSHFFLNLKQREKQETLQKLQHEAMKRDLILKRKNYADLVKETFRLEINTAKHSEIEPKPIFLRAKPAISYTVKGNLLPRKWKKNPLVPQPQSTSPPQTTDYLLERRKRRKPMTPSPNIRQLNWKNDIISNDTAQEKLSKIAEQSERAARANELKLHIHHERTPKRLERYERISTLLINAIQAKLAILNSTHNK